MNVLLYSPVFHPSVGGLEAVVAMLAEDLHAAGERVAVVSTLPFAGPDPFPFEVVRRPGPAELLRWTRWCDVYFQANVSLKGLWPLLLVRRPWVVSHHGWYRREDGGLGRRDRLKRRLLGRAAASISVSRAVARDLDTPSIVIENPYRDELFHEVAGPARERELLFVGRLVSDKGCTDLLDALARLRHGEARLTVVGSGPEEPALRAQVDALRLASRVRFAGTLSGAALVETMNRHRVAVVPSRYNEPFGIVALEAMACGCLVVGSEGGGLTDAVGPGGWTFPNGDAVALADLLDAVLGGTLPPPDPERVRAHLERHSRRAVASRYLDVLHRVSERTRTVP